MQPDAVSKGHGPCRGKKAAEERLAGREKRVASLEADMAALRAEAGSLRDERTSLKRELSSLDATNGNLLAVRAMCSGCRLWALGFRGGGPDQVCQHLQWFRVEPQSARGGGALGA